MGEEGMTLEAYQQLVEKQIRALLDVVQSVALGDLNVEVEIPEGIEVISELAVGIEMMVDDLREMWEEQRRARAELERTQRRLEAALAEARAAQRRFVRQAWETYVGLEGRPVGYVLSTEGEQPLTEPPEEETWARVMAKAAERRQAVTMQLPTEEGEEAQFLALPIVWADEVIGVLGFRRPEGAGEWDEETMAAVEEIAEQVGWALENQRLFDEVQWTSVQLAEQVKVLDCLNDVGRRIVEAPPIPDFLGWLAGRIPQAMRYPDDCVVAVEFEGQVYGQTEALTLPRQIAEELHVGEVVSGRMVVAYREEHDFLEQEVALLRDLVGRVGGYLENRRLLEQAQLAEAEAAATHRSYLVKEWQDYLESERALRRQAYLFDHEGVTTVPDFWREEMETALQQGELVAKGGEAGPPSEGEERPRTALVVPIKVRGQTIGVLGAEDPEGEWQWSREQISLIQAVADQLGQALEVARLLEATRRRAARERIVGEITARMRETLDVEIVARRAAQELGRALGAGAVTIRLGTVEQLVAMDDGEEKVHG